MILLLAITAGLAAACGLYLVLSRDLFRVVLGLAVLGSAVNLVIFGAGGRLHRLPPIIVEGERTLGTAADPVPQALVLTAIVIGFALACFSLVLVLRLVEATGSDDSRDLNHAEPAATATPGGASAAPGTPDAEVRP